MLVIGIHGPMGAGKSTVSSMIRQLSHGPVEVIPFAKALKDYCKLLGWDGKKDARGRRLLQLIGTECGRQCIDEDIWVDKWKEVVNTFFFSNPGGIVVVDDLRFYNEWIGVRSNTNCHLIKIKGRGFHISIWHKIKLSLTKNVGLPLVHKSEIPLPDNCFDSIIENTGNLQDLQDEVTHILAKALHGTI